MPPAVAATHPNVTRNRRNFPKGVALWHALQHPPEPLPITWEHWFRKFSESGLALLVQDKTAKWQRSNFNKLVSRETVGISEGSGSSSSRSRNQPRGQSASREEFSSEEEEE